MSTARGRITRLERWRGDHTGPCPNCRLVWLELDWDQTPPTPAPCLKRGGVCPWGGIRMLVIRRPPPEGLPPGTQFMEEF